MSANSKDTIAPPRKRTEKEYSDLGKAVATLFESGAISRKALYQASFVRGLLSGFGGVIGATVGIALFLWILSWFSEVPLIGRFFENLQDTINGR